MVKLKTSGRALPEVSEVKHKVVFGLPEAKGRQTILPAIWTWTIPYKYH
jgi:hypothetical protein